MEVPSAPGRRRARRLLPLVLAAPLFLAVVFRALPASSGNWGGNPDTTFCIVHHGYCADSLVPIYEGRYVGHDEPSIVFYSDAPGSGNDLAYTLTLPEDPPLVFGQPLPGTVYSAMLYETFWFGMALCDTQSAPEATTTCVPDSDSNIFDNPDPSAPDYIGNHPGTAFMELQFYPPRSGFSVDGIHWYVALNIFSVSYDQKDGIANNQDCINRVGVETVNSAHITWNGVADIPAGPLSRLTESNPNAYFIMNSGDRITVRMHDTPDGLQVVVNDLTSGHSGSMTASPANGFKQVVFDPTASTCTSVPYSFHPMYSTSSEHTRVPWAVHAYNIGAAVEVGHDEPRDNDDSDDDDVDGGQDTDFDGYSYRYLWPGSVKNRPIDLLLHPQPISISGPVSAPPGGVISNFERVAFEADLPVLEDGCNTLTGEGCSDPPPGASFYPFYTAAENRGLGCSWEFGGAEGPHRIDTFGGTSTSAYGDLLWLFWPGSTVVSANDYRQVIDDNPCPISESAIPQLRVREKLNFAPRRAGSSVETRRIDVANDYRLPVDINGITVSGNFAVQGTSCGATLNPKHHCEIRVSFNPQEAGIQTGYLTIDDTAANSPQVVQLSGTAR